MPLEWIELRLQRLGFCAALALLGAAPALLAQQPGQNTPGSTAASSRITVPITDSSLTTLKGNVHPLAMARYDEGPGPSTAATGRMVLLLRRSPAQQLALSQYLRALQDPASPSYRKWLTPESYGKLYGVSEADLAAVEGWLESGGFRIESVPAARNRIVFSGSLGLVESAFHTSIHSYRIAGVEHLANASDPQIPTALVPVVAGISPLNDFRAQPMQQAGPRGTFNPQAKRFSLRPDLTDVPDQFLFVTPADAAVIYNTPNTNLNPAATGVVDGTGVTIGIVGYSNLNTADVLNYRTAFLNDANPAHLPQVIIDGEDPGILAGGNALEALLDNEIASALAPGAAIDYYTAASSALQDGLIVAIERALDDNLISILNVSYSSCEAELGTAGNLQFSEFWQQGAAQGISVLVSAGDSGSAGCDDPGGSVAENGLAVSGIASTPFNIAVGGTDFPVLDSVFSQYVSSSNGPPYYGTALRYIPEVPWNDSIMSFGPLAGNTAYRDPSTGATNIIAAGGGLSSHGFCAGAGADGSCAVALTGYPKPAFQNSVTGSDGVRDLPDVSFLAANGQNQVTWAACIDSTSAGTTGEPSTDCQTSGGAFTNATTVSGFGGTSASAPAFAGILAMVSETQSRARLGQADSVLYNLAKNQSSVFHDVTAGNNSVPCTAGGAGCGSNDFLSGYNAVAGYDTASGLGSLNVSALTQAWSTAAFTATTTSLMMGTSVSTLSTGSLPAVPHGTPLVFKVGVAPTGAGGSVSITNTSGVQANAANASTVAALAANGTAQFTSNTLPGGAYSVSASYSGDATHTGGESNSIAVDITPEPSTTAVIISIGDPSTGVISTGSTMAYGAYSFVQVEPYGSSSPTVNGSVVPDGVPTGSVVVTLSGSAPASVPLNSTGTAEYAIYDQAPGNYAVQATYSGDTSFASSASANIPLTITKAPITMSASTSARSITAESQVEVTVSLQTDSIGLFPRGGVTVATNGVSYAGAGSLGITPNGTVGGRFFFVIPGSALVPGSNTLVVTYPGDTNYGASSTSASVSLSQTGASASFVLTGPTGGITVAAPGQTDVGDLLLTPTNGFSGQVALSCIVSGGSSGATPTCVVPVSVALSGSAAYQVPLTISTTGSSTAALAPSHPWRGAAGAVAMACLLLFPGVRRRGGCRRIAAVLVCSALTGAIGCGSTVSGSSTQPVGSGTPAGTYQVMVTGTSGNIGASAAVTVTVR